MILNVCLCSFWLFCEHKVMRAGGHMCVVSLLTGTPCVSPSPAYDAPVFRFSWPIPHGLPFWPWYLRPLTVVPLLSESTAPWPWTSYILFTMSPSYSGSMKTWSYFLSHLRISHTAGRIQICWINEVMNEQNLYLSFVIMIYLYSAFPKRSFFFFQNKF